MIWKFESDRAIYSQIVEQIKLFIISDKVKKGERLSSVRTLAQEAGVNPNTMQRALTELEQEGLIVTNRTSGKFITEDDKLISETKRNFAHKKVEDFISDMENSGFKKNEIILLVESFKTYTTQGKE